MQQVSRSVASDRWSWLRDVVLKDLRLLPQGLVYATITLIAALQRLAGWGVGNLGTGRKHPASEGAASVKTMNICFHGVGTCRVERESGESRYWVNTDSFLRILDELVGRSEVRISFDDGNRSDVTIALPALRERGLDATFFVLAGRFDDPDSLDRDDVRELRAAGMTIGTHGWAHIPWPR